MRCSGTQQGDAAALAMAKHQNSRGVSPLISVPTQKWRDGYVGGARD